MEKRVNISGNILEWAISRNGQSVQTYEAANGNVTDWINGTKKPTIRQIENFAKKVHVPFGYLFLSTPPVENSPIPFFRGTANNGPVSLNTYDTVLTLQYRQEWLEEYFINNDFEKCSLVESCQKDTSEDKILTQIRTLLSLPTDWAFKFQKNEDALGSIVKTLEDLNIVIEFNSVVGNNTHRHIDVNECRGFALVNKMAPFIFVNSADSKSAQLFTIVHEFAHLLLGVSSGFGGESFNIKDENESLCDKIAANFLVPTATLKNVWNNDLEKMARKFKVSSLVIARRAKDTGLITSQAFWDFYNNRPVFQHDISRKSKGGSFYSTAKQRLGFTFAVHVNNAVKSNQLSQIEASRLTGLYGNTYNSFMTNLK